MAAIPKSKRSINQMPLNSSLLQAMRENKSISNWSNYKLNGKTRTPIIRNNARKLILEEIVMAPPGQTANGLIIYIHSTVEIDIDIEVTRAKIKLVKDKIAE